METLTQKHFRFGDFELDVAKRLLLREGTPLSLNSKTFDLLLALLDRRGEVLTKDELLETVWPDQFVEEGNLTVQISTLRKIFGEAKNEHRFIVTVPGRGYSFVADVEDQVRGEIVVENHRVSTIVVEEEEEDVFAPADAITIAPAQLAGSRRSLKPIMLGLAILTIAALGLGYWFGLYGPAKNQIESVAVMPFANESGNSDLDYLSDGLTETLIGSLAQLPDLSVKARSSVFRYKGKDVTPMEIGRDLKVHAMLLGRLAERADRIIVYVSLVDTRTGDQIWGEQYDRPMSEAATLQKEISSEVSHKLRAKLSTTDEQKVAKEYTSNTEAYLLYMKGRYCWNKRTVPDLRKAIEFFQRATELDPNYALAFAGLADAYSLLGNYGGGPSTELQPKALTAALKALSMDDDLAEAHTSLGGILGDFNFDYAGEEREYKRAIELNPNYATAHHWYGEMLARDGRYEEAERELKNAIELDPLSPSIARTYADTLYYAGRYDESLAELRKIVEFDPTFFHAYDSFAYVYQTTGDHAGCVESISKVEEALGEPGFAKQMRESFSRGGWEGFLNEMTGDRRPANLPIYYLAVYQTALGEKDAAFASLDRSYTNREGFILWIKVDPRLDPLRDDPRFDNLLAQVGYKGANKNKAR